jgi:HEAT repeat protein
VSDLDPGALARLDDDAWQDRVRGLAGGGREAELTEYLLEELTLDATWRRERVLRLLPAVEEANRLLPHLARALSDEAHADRRNAARSALAALAGTTSGVCEGALATLADLALGSPDADVRLLAAAALGESGSARARVPLERAARDPDPNVGAAAAESLGLLGDRRALPVLLELLDRGEFWTAAAALYSLGRLRDPRVLPAIGEALRDPALRAAAAEAVGEIGSGDGVPLLRPALQAGGEARAAALAALARILGSDPAASVPDWLRADVAASESLLVDRFERENDESTARLLGVAATPAAVEALLRAVADPDHGPVAAAGLEGVPPRIRSASILSRLASADPTSRTLLLGILPPLSDRSEIRAVADQLESTDAELRAMAADVLGESEPAAVLEELEGRVGRPAARLGVAIAYGRLGAERCEPLLSLLRDEDPAVRSAAASALGRCRSEADHLVVEALESETDPSVRPALVEALGRLGGVRAVAHLAATLADPEPRIRYAAAAALGRTREPAAVTPLLGALHDPAPEVRIASLQSLGEIGDVRVSSAVQDQLSEPDPEVRRTAAMALRRIAPPDALVRITAALDDPDREVRLSAVETLGKLGGGHVRAALERRIDEEPDLRVREAASRVLLELPGNGAPATA